MKNKIVWKLSIYFITSLLVFAFIISGIFIYLFRINTIELHKNELEQRATKISKTLSSITSDSIRKNQGSGYGAYLKFLNDIAMSDVWIVDENLNIITAGNDQVSQYSFSDLPSNAEEIVKEVFSGKTEFSESFSNILDTPTLTVGTPIKDDSGNIFGVVLLHSPVNGIDLAISKGIVILVFSIGIALMIAILLSIGFSFTFTKPLKSLNLTAIKLTEGDYTVKTNVKQSDEIGTLAMNMDILAQRLNESSMESEKLEQLRRDFIANISHELRTPVTVIRGSLEALNDGIITKEAQVLEYYSQMLAESKHLQRLIGDLLDLSRLQNTDFQLEMTQISICEVLSDVIRSAKSLAKDKQIEFVVNNNFKDCALLGDYGRLRQMILIIVDNAIKFSPQNGHIYINVSQDKNLILSIRDEGRGINNDDLPYVFDRFYKTKSIENKNGTGLGLAIAKQIAIRHNATIKLVNEIGVGCEFVFIFHDDL
ncbi:sensor histidine kinase [[Clostridium] fimetarium]|uniref:histidine kinase n=1 Tax=[Clostridium] fimetarium TaxID=99656 RepID=A0A1I0RU27_9FIRM|nr:ATP-binding protein [[Clostridium] fimetarium]SEW44826.1 Signal transduction histidine kinase [[Clostridium] fimetarium]